MGLTVEFGQLLQPKHSRSKRSPDERSDIRGLTLRAPQALAIAWRGVKTVGPMAPEIPMQNQRPAQYVFDSQVQLTLSQIRANEAREKAAKAAQTSASAA
jgi:hypothetical protein